MHLVAEVVSDACQSMQAGAALVRGVVNEFKPKFANLELVDNGSVFEIRPPLTI